VNDRARALSWATASTVRKDAHPDLQGRSADPLSSTGTSVEPFAARSRLFRSAGRGTRDVCWAPSALKQQQVWAIRFWLDQHRRLRDWALFDFAIDSKLRRCDIVQVRIGDVVSGGRVRDRAIIVHQKTKRPVQCELMDTARKTIPALLERRGGTLNDYVFPSRNDYMAHMSTRK
jgi:integrase